MWCGVVWWLGKDFVPPPDVATMRAHLANGEFNARLSIFAARRFLVCCFYAAEKVSTFLQGTKLS